MPLEEGSPISGRTPANADIRSRSGVSVVALTRGGKPTANPKSMTVFEVGDRIGLIGGDEQIDAARRIIEPPPDGEP
jgi:CPA2 family monovalent cation:H+ antiporter-2